MIPKWEVYQRGARFRIGYQYKTLFLGRIKVFWYRYYQGCYDSGDMVIWECRNKSQACEKLIEVRREAEDDEVRLIERTSYERDTWKGTLCD